MAALRRWMLTSVLVSGLLLVVARLLWIWRGWLDGEATLADDAFYYFQIARHVSQGLGPTFDGIAPTNGFHPLYLVVVSGLYEIWPQSPWVPIHTGLTLLLACDLASACVLYKIACRWSTRAGLAAALLWLSSPLAVATSHRGMESSLSTLLVLASTSAYLRWLDRPRDVAGGLLLGMLLGLAFLARTEASLFVFAVGVCALAARAREVPRAFVVVGLPFVGLVGPWVFWQWRMFGTWEQSSGTAIRMMNIYGHLDASPHTYWHPTAFLRLSSHVFDWIHRAALAQEFQPLDSFGSFYRFIDATLVCVVVAAAVTAVVRSALRRRLMPLAPLFIYAALHVMYYYGFAHTYRPWYHLTLVATFVLAGVALADEALGRKAFWTISLAWVALHVAGLSVYCVRAENFETSRDARGRIAWIEQSCGPTARVGLMNAGKLGYLAGFRSQLTVVNLDGVVNNMLLDSYRHRTFSTYFCTMVDFAIELPSPDVFRDEALQSEYKRFRADCVRQLPTKGLTLFRFRCDEDCAPAPLKEGPGT